MSQVFETIKKFSPNWLFKANFLLIAAFAVATLRQMGVNGHFVGYDPTDWSWFQSTEVYSGLAMAILEGLAIAYIARRWRSLPYDTASQWIMKGALLLAMIVLVLAFTIYTAMYAYAAQEGRLVTEVYSPQVRMFWSFLVAGVNPFIALLIGIVESDTTSVSKPPVKAVTKPVAKPAPIQQPKPAKEEAEVEQEPKPITEPSGGSISQRRTKVKELINDGFSKSDIVASIQAMPEWSDYTGHAYASDRLKLRREDPEWWEDIQESRKVTSSNGTGH